MTTELDMQRQQTGFFIDAKPSILTLTPRVRQTTADGTWVWMNQYPRLPQMLRVIEQAEPAVLTLEDGTQRKVTYMLLGRWDASIAKGDVFVYHGDPVEVLEMNTFNGYEQRASCDRYIGPPVTV